MRLPARTSASSQEAQASETSRASQSSGGMPSCPCSSQAQAGKRLSGLEPPECTSWILAAEKAPPERVSASATASRAARRACWVEVRLDHQRLAMPTSFSVSAPVLPLVSTPAG